MAQNNKTYRVYDKRTNETLFSHENHLDCVSFMTWEYGEEHEDYEHIFMEEVKDGETE